MPERQQESSLASSLSCSPTSQNSLDLDSSNNFKQNDNNTSFEDYDMKTKSNRLIDIIEAFNFYLS